MRIGVISDTHGLLRPQAIDALRNVEHILHAGDVGDAAILASLGKLAPVTAIRGNIDRYGPCSRLPAIEIVELAGSLVYMVHALEDVDIKPEDADVAVVVYGHSHKPKTEVRNKVLYLNPGSAGPRRFSLPISVAILTLGQGAPHAEAITLPV